jgi:branched-chain amino acid transport system substrate-binding protein
MAVALAGALVLAACGDDDDEGSGSDTTAAATTAAPDTTAGGADTTAAPDTTSAPDTTEAPDTAAFEVDTEACEDPDAATAPIEGDIKVGTSLPLSGGPAVLFAPYADGFKAFWEAYNAQGGVGGTQKVDYTIKDDQYTANLTKTAVDEMIDEGVQVFTGIIGSPNNAAVRDDLNALCYPQMFASTGANAWGDIESYPWTSGLLVPYSVESAAFHDFALTQKPEGGTAAIFYVNNEFGQAYVKSFKKVAEEEGLIEIVAEEKIDAADSGAPTAQMTNLVAADPDFILAIPLGAQCIAFMKELGNARAANAEFTPVVYQTATCANPIFFGGAGAGADGVFTSSNLLPEVYSTPNPASPGPKAYADALRAVKGDANPTNTAAAAGYLAAEFTAHVLEEAQKSDTGITRASVINAMRNINFQSSLTQPGYPAIMNAEDGFIGEVTQITQWSAAESIFKPVGDIISFEGETLYTD